MDGVDALTLLLQRLMLTALQIRLGRKTDGGPQHTSM
jgi:hypothetical protein